MGEIFELNIPAPEKLVLLAMADHARDDGTGCYPSVETLGRKTSQSRRGVQRIMRRLEQDGWIAPSKLSKGRSTTEYKITLSNREPRSLFPEPNRDPGSLLVKAQPRPSVHSTATLSTSNRDPGSPESLESLRNLKSRANPSGSTAGLFSNRRTEKESKNAEREVLDRVFARYLSKVGKNPKLYEFTRLRKQKGHDRLRECLKKSSGNLEKAEALFNLAIDALSASAWHMGDNPNKKIYNSWEENLCRSQEKFERWLEEA